LWEEITEKQRCGGTEKKGKNATKEKNCIEGMIIAGDF